jgi:hypothetical protein
MNDEDLFAVFTEKSGATTASRPKEGDADKKAPLEIIEYDGFCVDGAPAQHFDWRAVPSSANVRGWKPVTFQPLISVPLPLARRTCRSKDDVHDVHAATRGAAAVQMKKPAGNACFNCGESGHNVQCCPKPRDNDAINKRRKVSVVANSASIDPSFRRHMCTLMTKMCVHLCRHGNRNGPRAPLGWMSPGHLPIAPLYPPPVMCEAILLS